MSGHEPATVEWQSTSRHDHQGEPRPPGFWRSKTGLVTIAFLAIGGFFLVAEHRAHLVPYLGYSLPLLFVLACLPMHFMHGGHGDHGGSPRRNDDLLDGKDKQSTRHH
jgi:hypothetical protein